MKILVADDEKGLDLRYGRMFARRGYTDVDYVRTPQETIVLMRSVQYDLVLLDVNFENDDLDGIDVALATKDVCPNTQIYLCSAYDDIEQKTVEAGVNGYFIKPFDREELFRVIEAIEQKQ